MPTDRQTAISKFICAFFANFPSGGAKNLQHEKKYNKNVSHHMVNRNVVVDVQDIGPPIFLAVFCHLRCSGW